MNELEEKFYETGVVPVVVLEDAEDAVPLAQALVEGGLLSAEVTFRTAAAEESIRRFCMWMSSLASSLTISGKRMRIMPQAM